ncbi:hypothetical protein BHE74_00042430 [Ensete ventricosum]|nr:hypothetical protein GW17_00060470 [Ensete ventricosum]RWW51248.1 hypothetical protein BHE74_00042430 [Ensete ventricosum]
MLVARATAESSVKPVRGDGVWTGYAQQCCGFISSRKYYLVRFERVGIHSLDSRPRAVREWTWEEEDEEERDPPPWDRQPGRIPASGRRGAGGSVRSPPLVGYSPPPLAISLTSMTLGS